MVKTKLLLLALLRFLVDVPDPPSVPPADDMAAVDSPFDELLVVLVVTDLEVLDVGLALVEELELVNMIHRKKGILLYNPGTPDEEYLYSANSPEKHLSGPIGITSEKL